MKKLIAGAVALMLLLTGCTVGHAVTIEQAEEWKLVSLQSNDDGAALGMPQELDVSCTATQDGVLELYDATNDLYFYGGYEVIDSTANSVCYSVWIEGMEGLAVVSTTQLSDGTIHPVLVISVGDFTMNFGSTALRK